MILVGLLSVTALVWVGIRFWPQTAAINAARADPKAAARGKGPSAITAPDVHLDALADGKPKPESAPQRDLFRFKPKPPPPAPAPPVASAPAVSAPSGPPPPPPLPPIAMRFIGLVESPAQGQKIAILSDGRGTYQGQEGDIIEGRYRILRIGVESVEMAYLDGRGRQTIRLSGS
jgi:hypothetical protein